ncbi:hypothetical protein ABIE53_000489 [Burkholderia sp. OAS925]|uniref:hypothetical protein n=1 Tax=Paraburkholderia sp. OAS925 TaxID=2663827 RepID=UPI001788EC76
MLSSWGGEYRKGSRIRYALAYSPLAELLNLPLRFDPEVRIIDSDSTTENFHREPRKFLVMSPTVVQAIDGVLYEISFGGSQKTGPGCGQIETAQTGRRNLVDNERERGRSFQSTGNSLLGQRLNTPETWFGEKWDSHLHAQTAIQAAAPHKKQSL